MENYKEGEKKKPWPPSHRWCRTSASGGGGGGGRDERRQTIFDERGHGEWGMGGRSRQVQLECGVGLARCRQKRCAEKKVAGWPGKAKSAVDGEEVEAAASALSAHQTEAHGSRWQTANVG